MPQLATPLLLAALLLSAATATAQTTFRLGLRGGANRAATTLAAASNTSETFFSISADKAAIYGWQAGVAAEVAFGKWALQPALVFSQKGEKFHTVIASRDSGFPSLADQTSTNRYNWLELPLNLVYTMHGDHGLQLFAGPYVALGVGGRAKGSALFNSSGILGPHTQAIDDQINYGTDTNNRRLDAGINFGIGYRQGPVQVQVGYGLGLRNLHQTSGDEVADRIHNFGADAAYNRVAQLTGTYFFNL
ncbi:outer membrane beta-barrel protein [Hymenobacter sp. HMF4947]|uniref:Outer membrane beta-barrel protein n=1 Tax=Hymenobacter ginkgonis TaxID=2682976 RepID=A0A7K1TJS7_9BACT|nr:outer membrane beta-barrel protein [Hymenobacter ginkgonis]MVN78623.1 outer membrane beta-barrel protein [Hymenobacter ginkgonis]